jgi:hypothetical protein
MNRLQCLALIMDGNAQMNLSILQKKPSIVLTGGAE